MDLLYLARLDVVHKPLTALLHSVRDERMRRHPFHIASDTLSSMLFHHLHQLLPRQRGKQRTYSVLALNSMASTSSQCALSTFSRSRTRICASFMCRVPQSVWWMMASSSSPIAGPGWSGPAARSHVAAGVAVHAQFWTMCQLLYNTGIMRRR